jgi:hypothetical protein
MNKIVQHYPVPSNLLAQIGDMTVSFALLELEIQILLGALICKHQRIGQIIASQLSFAKLRATVVSLYRERHGEDDDFKTLKQLLNDAGKVEEERNRITHSVWGGGDSADKITRTKITCREKRGFQFQSEEFDEAKFIAFNNRINELAVAFYDLYVNLVQKGKVFPTVLTSEMLTEPLKPFSSKL